VSNNHLLIGSSQEKRDSILWLVANYIVSLSLLIMLYFTLNPWWNLYNRAGCCFWIAGSITILVIIFIVFFIVIGSSMFGGFITHTLISIQRTLAFGFIIITLLFVIYILFVISLNVSPEPGIFIILVGMIYIVVLISLVIFVFFNRLGVLLWKKLLNEESFNVLK